MKKYIIFIAGVCVFLATASVFAVSDNAQPFQALWDAVKSLQDQIANIQLTPGPQGPAGPTGPQGPAGEPSWDETRIASDEARIAALENNVATLTEKVNQIWDKVNQECTPGNIQTCDTGLNGICSAGTKTCSQQGVWGQCIQNNQPTTEICGDSLDNDCDGQVNENCPIQVGVLTVTRDASSPVSNIILGGKTGVPLMVFKLAANNVEDLDLDQLTIYATNGNFVNTFYFYDGTTLLGSVPGDKTATLVLPDGTLTIPTNSSKKVTVKADILPVDGTVVTNNSIINASTYGINNVQCTGKLSGADANFSGSALGYDMTLFKSRPYVAKDASTPSTTALIPTSSTKVAVFTITADAAEDITFENANGNGIRLEFSAHINDTTQSQLTFTLVNQTDNVTLATAQSAASIHTKNISSSVSFGFNVNSLIIGKGETKTLAVYLDTTDFDLDRVGESNSIQMYFDDAQPTAVKFGINGFGSYAQGAKIVAGDMYFGTLSNQN